MNIDTVIFDLDGTLVHTAPDLLRATNHVLEQSGRNPIALEQLLDTVSFGAKQMIKRGFELTGDPVGEAELDIMFMRFLDYYIANVAVDSHPFEGCIDLLEKCQTKGMKLGVCTNKFETVAVKLLAELDMLKYFAAVVGPDTINIAKPDPAPYRETIKRIGGDIHKSIMVGDSKIDIMTAKAAKVPVIACTFGYSDEPIEDLGADYVLGHYDEMAEVLLGSLPNRI